MEEELKKRTEAILSRAKKDYKGDYRIYKAYRNEVESLGVSAEDYQKIIKRLSKILGV